METVVQVLLLLLTITLPLILETSIRRQWSHFFVKSEIRMSISRRIENAVLKARVSWLKGLGLISNILWLLITSFVRINALTLRVKWVLVIELLIYSEDIVFVGGQLIHTV